MGGISTTSKGAFAPFFVLILLGSGIVGCDHNRGRAEVFEKPRFDPD
jgi:hypothetical protein